jgi:hypothetical protein
MNLRIVPAAVNIPVRASLIDWDLCREREAMF